MTSTQQEKKTETLIATDYMAEAQSMQNNTS